MRRLAEYIECNEAQSDWDGHCEERIVLITAKELQHLQSGYQECARYRRMAKVTMHIAILMTVATWALAFVWWSA